MGCDFFLFYRTHSGWQQHKSVLFCHSLLRDFLKSPLKQHQQGLKTNRRGFFKGEELRMPSHLNGFWYFFRKKYKEKTIKDARGIHSSSPFQSPSFKGFSAPDTSSRTALTLDSLKFPPLQSRRNLFSPLQLKPPYSAAEEN